MKSYNVLIISFFVRSAEVPFGLKLWCKGKTTLLRQYSLLFPEPFLFDSDGWENVFLLCFLSHKLCL